MSDAAVELDRWWRRCYGCQSCEFRCDHYYPADKLFADEIELATRDLTARLASAEEEITKTKDDRSYWAVRCHENVLEAHALRDERDTLKAERDRIAEQTADLTDEIIMLKAAVEQAHERTRTIMDAFRGCPDHVYQHDGCVMCASAEQLTTLTQSDSVSHRSQPSPIQGECRDGRREHGE